MSYRSDVSHTRALSWLATDFWGSKELLTRSCVTVRQGRVVQNAALWGQTFSVDTLPMGVGRWKSPQ